MSQHPITSEALWYYRRPAYLLHCLGVWEHACYRPQKSHFFFPVKMKCQNYHPHSNLGLYRNSCQNNCSTFFFKYHSALKYPCKMIILKRIANKHVEVLQQGTSTNFRYLCQVCKTAHLSSVQTLPL